MTEAQFQGRILTTCALLGWRVAHFRAARTNKGWRTPVAADGQGWPDLAMFHPGSGRTLFREVKTDTGRLTPHQQRWLDDLAACGHDAGVWRPRDWDTILEELQP